jgi:hypothetical protein
MAMGEKSEQNEKANRNGKRSHLPEAANEQRDINSQWECILRFAEEM